ncbi:MAG: O-antigen biosynthesis glycosyltransferase WbnH [Glaciecola sp. HTCC2999]|jgi:glycosyltransferase involved in cell wall biosynthesis|nr:MAG: O-antigen biosynthesis glycosyltransferase WbnH [Glaciecola sp. HTCC2999]
MKIALVLDSRDFGGIESHILELARVLIEYSLDLTVVRLADYGNHPLMTKLQNFNIPTHTLHGSFTEFFHFIKVQRFDIVHSHGYKANLYSRLVCRFTYSQSVSTFHSGDQGKGKLYLYDALDRWTGFVSHYNICVSEPIKASVHGSSDVMLNTINTQGIELEFGYQVGFVGRLSREKAPERFVALAKQFPEQQFAMFGDGPDYQTLAVQAPSNLTLHGHQADMQSVWKNISVLVLPSRKEGLPMVCLEAMVRGIPVIATDVGSIAQLITPDVDGWIVSEYSQSSFCDTLQAWFELPQSDALSVRHSARDKILSQFSMHEYVPQLLTQYQRLLTNVALPEKRGEYV